MKVQWLLIPLAAAFVSCNKEEPAEAAATVEKKKPMPTKIVPVAETPPPPVTKAPSPAADESPATIPPRSSSPSDTPAAPPKPSDTVPTAQALEGKPGFVLSPYNNKVIDVRGMPPGTLVADPTFPAGEKKHFRTPQ